MIATNAKPVAFADDVLTLAFRNQSDVASFKKLAAGKGPSEDLRGAIQQVLGIRVKYVAKHDPSLRPGRDGAGDGGPGADGGAGRPQPDSSDPDRAGGPRRDDDVASSRGRGSSVDGESERSGRSADAAGSTARTAPAAPQRASAAAAPVTEWAVAPIPGADAGPSAQLAVDDEPEEASAAPVRTLTLAREGEVLADADAPLTAEEEEELPPPVAVDAPIPPRAPVAVERLAAARPPQRTGKGIERVGEAVVRQMLGATFVREEPYTPPTRFN